MAESIRAFENSLRDFLINAQSDSYNTHGKVEYKYNNLKVIWIVKSHPFHIFGFL